MNKALIATFLLATIVQARWAVQPSLISPLNKTAGQLCSDWIYVHCGGQEATVENCRTDACLGDAANGLGCMNKCFDIPNMTANKYCFFGEPCIDMKSDEYKAEISCFQQCKESPGDDALE